MRRARLLLALALLGGCTDDPPPSSGGELPIAEVLPSLAARADWIVDGDGVSHLAVASLRDGFVLQGYADASLRFWQLDLARRRARGALAGLKGRGELEADARRRQLLLTPDGLEVERVWRAALSQDGQLALQDYADGVNAWLAQARIGSSRAPLPAPYGQLTPPLAATELESWSVEDSLAIAARDALASEALPRRLATARTALHSQLDDATLAALLPSGESLIEGRRLLSPLASALEQAETTTAVLEPSPVSGEARAELPPSGLDVAGLLEFTRSTPANEEALVAWRIAVTNSVDLVGLSLPGVPGFVAGASSTLAWAAVPMDRTASLLVDVPEAALGAQSRTLTVREADGGRTASPLSVRTHPLWGSAIGAGEGRALAFRWVLATDPGFLEARLFLGNRSTLALARTLVSEVGTGPDRLLLVDATGEGAALSRRAIPSASTSPSPFGIATADGLTSWPAGLTPESSTLPRALERGRAFLLGSGSALPVSPVQFEEGTVAATWTTDGGFPPREAERPARWLSLRLDGGLDCAPPRDGGLPTRDCAAAHAGLVAALPHLTLTDGGSAPLPAGLERALAGVAAPFSPVDAGSWSERFTFGGAPLCGSSFGASLNEPALDGTFAPRRLGMALRIRPGTGSVELALPGEGEGRLREAWRQGAALPLPLDLTTVAATARSVRNFRSVSDAR